MPRMSFRFQCQTFTNHSKSTHRGQFEHSQQKIDQNALQQQEEEGFSFQSELEKLSHYFTYYLIYFTSFFYIFIHIKCRDFSTIKHWSAARPSWAAHHSHTEQHITLWQCVISAAGVSQSNNKQRRCSLMVSLRSIGSWELLPSQVETFADEAKPVKTGQKNRKWVKEKSVKSRKGQKMRWTVPLRDKMRAEEVTAAVCCHSGESCFTESAAQLVLTLMNKRCFTGGHEVVKRSSPRRLRWRFASCWVTVLIACCGSVVAQTLHVFPSLV